MLVDLKLGEAYQGLVYLHEAERNPPMMKAHRHDELEANIVLSGMLSYIICG